MNKQGLLGFTLIEILVAITLLGILLSLGISNYIREAQKRQFYQELTSLTYTFDQARSTSVKTSTDQTVQISSSGNVVTLTYGTTTRRFTNLAFCVPSACGTTAQVTYKSPHGEMCWSSACTSSDAYVTFTRNTFSANLVFQGVFGYAAIRDLK
ncbi:prepilin-type N-terminal cleavage/methylation domain-containing protein [Deinococcus cellulosilyticus]|uniref:Prepilin-type N-terminal cleavage/methylation domain-containing protein n=1 Tax=Deinococcus cellulosilyticus (strain DSM 18568 / NBRC 106333 / KACC 11606 / 5516J-15) TaxID=1223518 RepID=A0A511MV59_DEIC1|nr:prepilin-type N-terminal cleavage/methylation domain-containing protein [Deinococcus cellulosilyticus]GEM44465.1 hypothetical protein DC3_01000 [Deinococcus cellulosilyticus NBRC 106333 = KACC 11606]